MHSIPAMYNTRRLPARRCRGSTCARHTTRVAISWIIPGAPGSPANPAMPPPSPSGMVLAPVPIPIANCESHSWLSTERVGVGDGVGQSARPASLSVAGPVPERWPDQAWVAHCTPTNAAVSSVVVLRGWRRRRRPPISPGSGPSHSQSLITQLHAIQGSNSYVHNTGILQSSMWHPPVSSTHLALVRRTVSVLSPITHFHSIHPWPGVPGTRRSRSPWSSRCPGPSPGRRRGGDCGIQEELKPLLLEAQQSPSSDAAVLRLSHPNELSNSLICSSVR